MTDPKEKPESGQNKPETSGPDKDVAPPEIEYVQNDESSHKIGYTYRKKRTR